MVVYSSSTLSQNGEFIPVGTLSILYPSANLSLSDHFIPKRSLYPDWYSILTLVSPATVPRDDPVATLSQNDYFIPVCTLHCGTLYYISKLKIEVALYPSVNLSHATLW